jgi:transglutaminase-like putative cysteine protease
VVLVAIQLVELELKHEDARQIRRLSMEALTNRDDFLAATKVVDHHHPAVQSLARELASGDDDRAHIAKRCFEWVRDEIQHSIDFRREELTCKASDVLAERTGFCYAKSHLLAALLRANDIPAGFCYQRLSVDGIGPPFSLHGLNAVWSPEIGWYRIDARGNKAGVSAEFMPPVERLAFAIQHAGEYDLPGVYSEPLPAVVEALTRYEIASELAANLPDVSKNPADTQKTT